MSDMWPVRHCLITGASSGLGAAMARRLACSGTRLSLLGRNKERLEAVTRDCQAKGSNVAIILADVTDREQMHNLIIKADKEHPIDLLIANAGISGSDGIDKRLILQTNIDGVLNSVEPLIDQMKIRRAGRIAIMASLAGFKSFPNAPIYCASKAAVRSYGEALAAQLNPFAVKVCVLCPGFVTTPLTAKNPFPMPFIMDADKAASIMITGIKKNKVRIAFPLPVYAFTRLLEILPAGLSKWVLETAAKNQGIKE